MKINKIFVGLSILGFSALASAETIHGVCDDLQGTGAAYGLCVAICEVPAEDEGCMPTFVDGVLIEDSLDDCRPASMKLIEKFQEKAPAGVELPCGDYQSSVSCPCPDPDVDASLPYSCNSQPNGSSGLIQRFPLDGSLTLFTVRPLKDGWICRTVTRDGVRTVLPIPGQPGDGTEVDACIDKYRSYCP